MFQPLKFKITTKFRILIKVKEKRLSSFTTKASESC